MKRTNVPGEKFPFHGFNRENHGSAESVLFVSTIALICLYLWLIVGFWID